MIIDKVKLTRKYDKRYKLTEEEEQKIISLRESGATLKELAIKFNVSCTTISLITNPTEKKQFQEYRKTYKQKREAKEKHTQRTRELRSRKRELHSKGEI